MLSVTRHPPVVPSSPIRGIFGALALDGNKSLGVVGSTDSNTTGTFVAWVIGDDGLWCE